MVNGSDGGSIVNGGSIRFMPAQRAAYTPRALVLLKTMRPVEAAAQLRTEGFGEVSSGTLRVLKNRNKEALLSGPTPVVVPTTLIPKEWGVLPRHKAHGHALMLRLLARRLHGMQLAESTELHDHQVRKLDRWLLDLVRRDQVIHYDPATGFELVPRRYWSPAPGVQRPLDEWIRDPLRDNKGFYIK